LAEELCRIASIANPGPASTGHVRRWLDDGIAETTIRTVVAQMAAKGGATRSLKRFNGPIRREHAANVGGEAREARPRDEPKTRDELAQALRCAEDHGWDERAGELRVKLEALIRETGDALRVPANEQNASKHNAHPRAAMGRVG
jgi:hypothetical protein